MATFPGTQLLGNGGGPQVLLPDGSVLNFSLVTNFGIDPLNPLSIIFNVNGVTASYAAPSASYAKLVLAGLRSIPSRPAGFYVATDLIPAVAITALSATSGPAAGGTAITIDGAGFQSGCAVNFGGIGVAATFVNATQVTITSPAGTQNTTASLILVNPDGTHATSNESFTWT